MSEPTEDKPRPADSPARSRTVSSISPSGSDWCGERVDNARSDTLRLSGEVLNCHISSEDCERGMARSRGGTFADRIGSGVLDLVCVEGYVIVLGRTSNDGIELAASRSTS